MSAVYDGFFLRTVAVSGRIKRDSLLCDAVERGADRYGPDHQTDLEKSVSADCIKEGVLHVTVQHTFDAFCIIEGKKVVFCNTKHYNNVLESTFL